MIGSFRNSYSNKKEKEKSGNIKKDINEENIFGKDELKSSE